MKLDLSQPVRKVLTTNNMHWGKATAAGQHPSTVAHDHQQLPGTSNRYTLWGKGRMVIGCQRWSLSNMSCGNILMNLLWMPWILKGWVFLVKHVPWEFGSVREVGQVITVTAQLFCEILLWWYCCHFRLVELNFTYQHWMIWNDTVLNQLQQCSIIRHLTASTRWLFLFCALHPFELCVKICSHEFLLLSQIEAGAGECGWLCVKSWVICFNLKITISECHFLQVLRV